MSPTSPFLNPQLSRRGLFGGSLGVAALAGAATWAPVEAFADETFLNPGFEDLTDGWPTHWTAFNAASRQAASITHDPVHGGENALRIEDNTATGIGVRSAKVPGVPGEYYDATIHALVVSGNFAMYLEFWNEAGTRIATQHTTFGPTADWQLVRIRAQAPEGTSHVTILPYSFASNRGVAHFDDAGIGMLEYREPELFGIASSTAAVRGATRVGDLLFFLSRHPIEQGAARLGAVNFRTGELEYTLDVNLGNGAAGSTMTTDGTHIYIGPSGGSHIWKHLPGSTEVTQFVNLGGSRWVYSMNVHEDHLYFGTYNDGTVRRARLSDGVVDVTYGRVSESMYATGADANSQYVFGGSSAPGTLLRWPKEGGEPLDLTSKLSESPVGILDMRVTEDQIYVACGKFLVSMDMDGNNRVAREIPAEDRYLDKVTIAPDSTIYAMARLTTNVYKVTDTALEKVAQPLNYVENQFLGVVEDGTIVGVTGLGHAWWVPPGGQATVFDTAETEFGYPDEPQSMLLHSNGTIWVGGHYAMTVHDIAAGTEERFLINGEPKGIVEGPDGVVYAAMYPSATVISIQPDTHEIEEFASISGQMRTMDMDYDAKRQVLMVGTGPTAKRYDGAVTFIDIKTGNVDIRQDILPNHRVHGIAHDEQIAYIVGDTVGEGNTEPLEPVALVAAVDLDSREVLWREALREDWASYEDVVLVGDVLYCMARRPRDHWFAYDVAKKEIIDSGNLGGYGGFGEHDGHVYSWVHWALEIAELPSEVNPDYRTIYAPVPNGWYNNPFFCITPDGKYTWGMWGAQLARFQLQEGDPDPVDPEATSASVAPVTAVGRTANVWGTVPTGKATVRTQVKLPDGRWATSQTGESNENGWYVIKLTYGKRTAGTYTWRVVVDHADGRREITEEFTQTRVAVPTAATAGAKPTGSTANVWGTVAGTAGLRVWTEIQLADGRWVKSQETTTEARGWYAIELTYGKNTRGTYRWRVRAQHPEAGILTSEEFTFTRT